MTNVANPTTVRTGSEESARTAGPRFDFQPVIRSPVGGDDRGTIAFALFRRERALQDLGVLHLYPEVPRLRRMFEEEPQPPGSDPTGREQETSAAMFRRLGRETALDMLESQNRASSGSVQAVGEGKEATR